MKRLKSYEQFQNEELNFKKTLAGVALGASLIGGMSSCKKSDIKPGIDTTQSDLVSNSLVRVTANPYVSEYMSGYVKDSSFTVTVNLKIYKKSNNGDQMDVKDSDGKVITSGKFKIIETTNKEMKVPSGSVVFVNYTYTVPFPSSFQGKLITKGVFVLNGTGGLAYYTNTNSPMVQGDADIVADSGVNYDIENNQITVFKLVDITNGNYSSTTSTGKDPVTISDSQYFIAK